MQKIFKGMGDCPFTGNAVDSPACRKCQWYVRAGTETFIWCGRPEMRAAEPLKKMAVAVREQSRKKSGRPKKEQAKTGKRKISPNKTREKKKR